MQKLKSAARQRRGAIMVLAALLMTVMAGMIAFAVDVGRITLAREQLQVAADAAAIAGADSLVNGPNAAITAAQTFAQSNSAGGAAVVVDPSQDIQLGKWDSTTFTFTALTGAAQSSANAVRVTCSMTQARGNPLTLFFAPILGRQSVDISAEAVSQSSSTVCGPFIGLNSVDLSGGSYTDSYNSTQGPYSASSAGSNGNVCSNGNISLSGSAAINGNAHPGVGQTVNTSGGSQVTGSTSPLTQALNEPSVSAPSGNNNANIPGSFLDSNGNFRLKGSDSFSLPAGTYYFSSFTLSGGSQLTVSGQTIIYCSGTVDLSGGTVLNSTPANCQIYGLSTCSQVTLSGSADFYGVVYAPSASIKVSGGAGFYGMLVGASLSLSGSGGCHYDQSLSVLAGAQQSANLVQ